MPGRLRFSNLHNLLLSVLFVILPSAGLAFGPLATPCHLKLQPALHGDAALRAKALHRASAHGRLAVTMQESSEGRSVSRTSEQLSCLIKRLQVASAQDASDPIAQIERYLRRVQLKKNDVHDLAMNLAAEKALNCELDVEASECDVLSDARNEGWWKLSYSSHKLLLALIRTTNLYQKITMEKGSVKISNVVGDPAGLSAGIEGEAHHRDGPARTPRGRLAYTPSACFLSLSPSKQLRIPLPLKLAKLPSWPGSDAVKEGKGTKSDLEFYHDVLYSDDELRVDWDASGGLDIFLHVGESEGDEEASWGEGEGLACKVPGPLRLAPGQWLPSVLLAPLLAALLTLSPASATADTNAAFNAPFLAPVTAGSQQAQVRLAEGEAAVVSSPEEEKVLAKKPMLSKEVGAVLIAPLVIYRVWATVNGVQVSASLDFSLLACLLSFVNRFL
mmetsp:Transcript_6161/g.14336  ORF Transcript_6161/g.14336 Transcript_6161/m.14336 type:complete len:446 (-) Transcript_6161:37-1374(-)